MNPNEYHLDYGALPSDVGKDESETMRLDAAPRRPRGPGQLGQAAAAAIAKNLRPDRAGTAVEEQALHQFAQQTGCLISESEWQCHRLVSAQTAEHEVRFRSSDFRALKKTWLGTYGFIPRNVSGKWKPAPATPSEYLSRMALQNELFADTIELEGLMISSGPSLIIGEPAGGLSLVVSQPWLEAADNACQFPSEDEIKALMMARGFRPIFASLFGWESSENHLIILDAKPDNFIKTTHGTLPIDLLIVELETSP